MTILGELEKQFVERISSLTGELPWQKKAWQRFLEEGLPSKRHERYRYVKLRALYEGARTRATACLPYLPAPAQILPLDKAYVSFRSYLEKQFSHWLEYEKDPFALLSGALASEGLFLFLPPHTKLEEPILIEQPEQLVIYLAEGSSLKLRLLRNQASEGWMQRRLDVQIDERAHLQLQLEPHDEQLVHLDVVRANLKREALFKTVVLPSPSPLSRQDYHIRLQGEGASAALYGLTRGAGEAQNHTYVLMEHLAPHTRSMQHFKAALGGKMKHSFEGKIYIHSQAQQVEAYQRHNSLILSERAESKSKPNLEIFADDVKASHGATCGRLDESSIFYLKSRGMTEERARSMLIDAFCDEVLHGHLL